VVGCLTGVPGVCRIFVEFHQRWTGPSAADKVWKNVLSASQSNQPKSKKLSSSAALAWKRRRRVHRTAMWINGTPGKCKECKSSINIPLRRGSTSFPALVGNGRNHPWYHLPCGSKLGDSAIILVPQPSLDDPNDPLRGRNYGNGLHS